MAYSQCGKEILCRSIKAEIADNEAVNREEKSLLALQKSNSATTPSSSSITVLFVEERDPKVYKEKAQRNFHDLRVEK